MECVLQHHRRTKVKALLNTLAFALEGEGTSIASLPSSFDATLPVVSEFLPARARGEISEVLADASSYGERVLRSARWDCKLSAPAVSVLVSMTDNEIEATMIGVLPRSACLTTAASTRLSDLLEPCRSSLRDLWLRQLDAHHRGHFAAALATLPNTIERTVLKRSLATLAALPRWIFKQSERFAALSMRVATLDPRGAAFRSELEGIIRDALAATTPELADSFREPDTSGA